MDTPILDGIQKEAGYRRLMRLTKALKRAPQNPELFKDYGTAFSQFMNRSARGASRASMPSRYVVDNYMRSWQNMDPLGALVRMISNVH